MSDNDAEDRPVKGTKSKENKPKSNVVQGVETKHRVRKGIVWGALSGLLFWLAQILDNHKLLFPTLATEVVGVLASARFGWICFVNHIGKHRVATPLSCVYVFIGWAVCGWLFWREYTLPSDNLAANTYKEAAAAHKALDKIAGQIDAIGGENRLRHLSGEQVTKLVERLKSLSREKIEIKAVVADPEAIRFQKELLDAFESAGFQTQGSKVLSLGSQNYPDGVTVIERRSTAQNADLAVGIRKALKLAAVEVSLVETHDDADPRCVNILVGAKPSEGYKVGAKQLPWQPEELPEGCKKVFFTFGNNSSSWPVSMIMDTNFVPGGIGADGPYGPLPVRPYIKDNRLYVMAPVLFGAGTAAVSMGNEWDDKIPPQWDRNFSATAFEVVDEHKLPVMQVLYKRANEISMNGVFQTGHQITVVFGGAVDVYSLNYILSNHVVLPERKALFKYPSWQHRGEYAEQSNTYELLPSGTVAEIVKKLTESTSRKAAIVIHPVNPDEAAFALSKQLKKIFSEGGYGNFLAPPPRSIPEVPGISCFVYGMAAADGALLEALQIILNKTKSHPELTVMPGDIDPWYTNSVVVIMIRKK